MHGFSLRLNKNSSKKIMLENISYDNFKQSGQKKDQTLFLFEDEEQKMVERNGCVIYTIGTLVYRDSWGHSAINEIMNDLEKDNSINEILKLAHGQFCLVIFKNNKVIIITDKLATFPIYIYEDSSFFHISNILLNIVRNYPVTFNYQAVSEYLNFDYCFDKPFFNEIKLLDHGMIYYIDRNVKKERYYDFLYGIEFDKYTDLDEATEKSKSILLKNFRFIENDKTDKIFIDLTGGLDTRLIASLLRSRGIEFQAGICGEQNINEEKIAKKISTIFGLDLFTSIKIEDKDVFEFYANKQFEISNGVPIYLHSTELLNYYQFIQDHFDIHISGFAGSQIFDNFLPQISFISKNIKPNNLIAKSFSYKDIFKNEILDEKNYNRNITTKIYGWLDRLGTRAHDHSANYFVTTTFSKFYHGSLLGLHNTILPVYVPYLEADLVRMLIECSIKLKHDRLLERSLITTFNEKISNIVTTHGYTSNVNSVRKESNAKKLKDVLRAISYDFKLLNDASRLISKKIKPTVNFAEIQRKFWIDEIQSQWTNDMNIFDFIDNKKLNIWLEKDNIGNQLKAKLLYLENLKDEINSTECFNNNI